MVNFRFHLSQLVRLPMPPTRRTSRQKRSDTSPKRRRAGRAGIQRRDEVPSEELLRRGEELPRTSPLYPLDPPLDHPLLLSEVQNIDGSDSQSSDEVIV